MRMSKPSTFKMNRRRDPYAASLRSFRSIRFDEKRLALQTLQAWQDLWDWKRNLNDDEDLDNSEEE